ncbi:hypothetical protein LCGC14_2229770 [marine sediment metagenome]|uniref:Uncharacterized protein n=1 Tax=marine sediment metagenome TaxID=412755 RepID=A0A0F9DW98_9ZZZZ
MSDALATYPAGQTASIYREDGPQGPESDLSPNRVKVLNAVDWNTVLADLRAIEADLRNGFFGELNIADQIASIRIRLSQAELDITERPRMLTVAITGVDIDPNDGGAPLIITNAPFGTTYQQATPPTEWRKEIDGSWTNKTPHAGKLSPLNKVMASLATFTDGDKATSVVVATAPVVGGTVEVFLNGVKVSVGNGAKNQFCYFSIDNGANALFLSGIAVGATLHWVGSVATFELDGTEQIEFIYVVP